MKTVYWDMSELSPNSGVFGISSSEVNVVPAGTTFRVMSPRTREQTPQYGEVEERYGIFFFFSDRALCPGPGGRMVWNVNLRRGRSLLYHTRGGALSGV